MSKLCFGCMRPKEDSPVCEHCGWDENQENQPHQLPIGTTLQNQYLVGRVLGQGGFGITYMGWDQHLSTPVAIKEYYPYGVVQRNTQWSSQVMCTSGEAPERFENHKERFLKEARTLAKLAEIPEIVQVKNYFRENGTAYIVMEYVRGITLKEHLKKLGRPMTEKEALAIMEPVIEALQRVHEQKLIHRDISPDNIMLPEKGGVKLIDFGAVRYVDASGASKSTEAVLKPGFAPIEQYNSRGNLGSWTDVYAVCGTICYLLTGKYPPEAPERLEMGDRLLMLRGKQGISKGLITALENGMRVRASARTENMEKLYGELYGASRKKKRIWPVVAACVAGLVLLSMLFTVRKDPTDVVGTIPAPSTEAVAESQPVTIPMTTEAPVTEPFVHPAIAAENVLMEDSASHMNANQLWEHYENVDKNSPAFRTTLSRKQVEKIVFLDTLSQCPENAADVSQKRNGKVFAWSEGTTIYIAAEGGVAAPANSSALFAYFTGLKTIEGQLVTDNVVSMANLFLNCEGLESLDMTGFCTSSVTDLSYMFAQCSGLRELKISGWDTSNVTNMANMFEFCAKLTTLDLSALDTGNVSNMYSMFIACESLESLDLQHFRTENVTNMSSMFNGCRSLKSLNLSGFDTANVRNMSSMFYDCRALSQLDLSSFDTASVVDLSYMFTSTYQLKDVAIGNFQVSGIRQQSYYSCFMDEGDKVNGTNWREWFLQ